MEIIGIGFLLGIVATLILIIIIRLTDKDDGYNQNDNSELWDRNNSLRIYILDGDRNWSCNNRYYLSNREKEDMFLVLQNVKRLTHGYEREILEKIIDFIDYD